MLQNKRNQLEYFKVVSICLCQFAAANELPMFANELAIFGCRLIEFPRYWSARSARFERGKKEINPAKNIRIHITFYPRCFDFDVIKVKEKKEIVSKLKNSWH